MRQVGVVGHERVGGVQRGLLDQQHRVETHDDGLGRLVRAVGPRTGHGGEVALDERALQLSWSDCTNPSTVAESSALGRSSLSTAAAQAASLAAIVGTAARANAAWRRPVAVLSRASSSSIRRSRRRPAATSR